MSILKNKILDTIIEAKSLLRLIRDQNSDLIVIDARPFTEYVKGHIPLSVNLDLMHFHWFDTSEEGIYQFERQMRILLNYLGIDKSSFVVFYDDISGPSASRGVWLLHYFSHYKVYILNGGFLNWKKLNFPVEMKTNQYSHSDNKLDVNRNVLADFKYIRNKIELDDKNVIIIDCRSEMEYNGLVVRAYRRGHIPNSINIDWVNNLTNEKFKEFKKLDNLYSYGSKDLEIITYCQGGYRAANTYLILKNLGYSNVKMYLGSWGEWGNNPKLPVE